MQSKRAFVVDDKGILFKYKDSKKDRFVPWSSIQKIILKGGNIAFERRLEVLFVEGSLCLMTEVPHFMIDNENLWKTIYFSTKEANLNNSVIDHTFESYAKKKLWINE